MKIEKDFIEYDELQSELNNLHISEFIIRMSNALNGYVVRNKITPEKFEEYKKTDFNFRSFYGGLKSGCVRGLKKKFKEKFVRFIITNDKFNKENINSVFINDMVYRVFNEKIDNNSMSEILSEYSIQKAKRGYCFDVKASLFTDVTIKKINLIMKSHLKRMKEDIKEIEVSFIEREKYTKKKI